MGGAGRGVTVWSFSEQSMNHLFHSFYVFRVTALLNCDDVSIMVKDIAIPEQMPRC